MGTAATMKADLGRSTEDVDVTPLLGHWINTTAETEYICKIHLWKEGDVLKIRCFGSSDGSLVDWGEREAVVHVGGRSTRAGGFHTQYDFGNVVTELASNEKLGILVIQSYTRYKDGSGRTAHFSREFFHR